MIGELGIAIVAAMFGSDIGYWREKLFSNIKGNLIHGKWGSKWAYQEISGDKPELNALFLSV